MFRDARANHSEHYRAEPNVLEPDKHGIEKMVSQIVIGVERVKQTA